jgi:hypothetical protein
MKKISLVSKSSLYLVIVFFLATLFFDFIDKWTLVYSIDDVFKFNKYLKLIFIVCSLLITINFLRFIKQEITYILINVLVLIGLFFIVKPLNNETIIYLLRYLFLFFLLPIITILKKNHHIDDLKRIFFYLIDIIVVLNFILIIIGIITQEQLFFTYLRPRFGYNGIMLNQMQSPYFYISFIFLLDYQKKRLLLIVALLSSLLMGVKALLLGIFLFIIAKIFFVEYISLKKKLIYFIIIIVLSALILALLLSTPIFIQIVNEKGLITAILSFRDQNLINIISRINSENFNFFFGCLDLQVFRCEFEIIDVFLFFGIIGLVLYTFLMTKIFNEFCTSLISKIYFFVVIIIFSLAGNFFYFPINTFIFMITLLLLGETMNYKKIDLN